MSNLQQQNDSSASTVKMEDGNVGMHLNVINGESSDFQKQQRDTILMESETTPLDKQWEAKFKLIKSRIKISMVVLLAVAYFAYFGYAMYCKFGDEASIRLLIGTLIGVLYLSGTYLLKKESISRRCLGLVSGISDAYSQGRRPLIVRWTMYGAFSVGCVTFIVVNIGLKEPEKLRSLVGIVTLVLVMVLLSQRKRKIKWHTVFWSFMMQVLLGVFVEKTETGRYTLKWLSSRLLEFMEYSKSGSIFLFGDNYEEHHFAFAVLPQIIMFCSAVQVLIYLGTIPFIVKTFGRLVAFVLDVSAPEAMNATANILLGGPEAAMIVRSYLDDMPASHLFAIMTNAGASCGGSALLQFIGFGASPRYLLSASIMSAPAALACAKIMLPDADDDDVNYDEKKAVKQTSPGDTTGAIPANAVGPPEPKGIIGALVVGMKAGLALTINLAGIMIVFNAIVDMLDATVAWFGDRVDVDITMKLLLSYLFYPVVYIMGVDVEDCRISGQLLGLKIISNPLLGYKNLGEVLDNRGVFEEYTALYNSSNWHHDGNDIYLDQWNQTLTGGIISKRSEVVLTYALCGFASLTSLGGAIGILGALVPSKMNMIAKLALPSLVAGVIASFLTASVAGLIG